MTIARSIAGTVLGCALLIAPCARAADDSINEEARKHFSAGVNLLQDPDGARYEDAYREFEAAYSASLSPKILGNIGYCALKLERDGEAISAYTRYLQEVRDVDPAEAAQISRDVATLRAGLVRVTVTVDSPDASIVDKRLPVRGESITNLYNTANGKADLGLRPGHHIIEVKAHGETTDRWEFDAKPSATLSRAFTTKTAAEAPRRSSSHTVPWIVIGVGGATLVAGGILGAMTLGKVTTISNNCPNNQCPPESTYALKPAQEDARRFIRITDTLLIGGGVVTVAGLWLYVAMGGSESPRPAAAAVRSASAQPLLNCSPSGCVAALNGTF
jgi:hypothetical protein